MENKLSLVWDTILRHYYYRYHMATYVKELMKETYILLNRTNIWRS